MIDAITERKGRIVVLIDELDEAAIGEAGRIARELLKPLAARGGLLGAKVLVGTRRWADLLADLGETNLLVDLDSPRYFERQDLIKYVTRRLMRADEPDVSTPIEPSLILQNV